MKIYILSTILVCASFAAFGQVPEEIATTEPGKIVGGAQIIKFRGNINTITSLQNIKQSQESSVAWDTVNNTLWQYDRDLIVGKRWVRTQAVQYSNGAPVYGVKDTAYKMIIDTTNRQVYVCNKNGCTLAGGGGGVTASNGLTLAAGDVKLGGTLTQTAIILTDATNRLQIRGLQSSVAGDSLVTIDPLTGTLRRKNASIFQDISSGLTSPSDTTKIWYNSLYNSYYIYQNGSWKPIKGYLDVADFGAGKYRKVTVSATANATILTAASGTFSANDTFKQIAVRDAAGGVGNIFVITAFSSSSQVSISYNVGSVALTNSEAYILENSSIAFQNAIDSAARASFAEAKIIYVGAGMYSLLNTVKIPQNITIWGRMHNGFNSDRYIPNSFISAYVDTKTTKNGIGNGVVFELGDTTTAERIGAFSVSNLNFYHNTNWGAGQNATFETLFSVLAFGDQGVSGTSFFSDMRFSRINFPKAANSISFYASSNASENLRLVATNVFITECKGGTGSNIVKTRNKSHISNIFVRDNDFTQGGYISGRLEGNIRLENSIWQGSNTPIDISSLSGNIRFSGYTENNENPTAGLFYPVSKIQGLNPTSPIEIVIDQTRGTESAIWTNSLVSAIMPDFLHFTNARVRNIGGTNMNSISSTTLFRRDNYDFSDYNGAITGFQDKQAVNIISDGTELGQNGGYRLKNTVPSDTSDFVTISSFNSADYKMPNSLSDSILLQNQFSTTETFATAIAAGATSKVFSTPYGTKNGILIASGTVWREVAKITNTLLKGDIFKVSLLIRLPKEGKTYSENSLIFKFNSDSRWNNSYAYTSYSINKSIGDWKIVTVTYRLPKNSTSVSLSVGRTGDNPTVGDLEVAHSESVIFRTPVTRYAYPTDCFFIQPYITPSTNQDTTAWKLGGNNGTTAGTNYIGTGDNIGLSFKTNNVERMGILSTGQIAIGQSGDVNSKLAITSNLSQTMYAINNATSGFKIAGVFSATGSMSTANGFYSEAATTAGSSFAAAIWANAYQGTNKTDVFWGNASFPTGQYGLYGASGRNNYLGTGNTGFNITSPLYKVDIDGKTGSAGNPIRATGFVGATLDTLLGYRTATGGIIEAQTPQSVVNGVFSSLCKSGTTTLTAVSASSSAGIQVNYGKTIISPHILITAESAGLLAPAYAWTYNVTTTSMYVAAQNIDTDNPRDIIIHYRVCPSSGVGY